MAARVKPLAAAALLAALWLALALPAAAEGREQTVYLGYLPEVSTWGAYEAGGVAVVDVGAGTMRLTVHDLPSEEGLAYEAWLVPAEERDVLISMGRFSVDAGGRAEVRLAREGLPRVEYRLVVITAESVPDDDPAPNPRQALGGVFPNARAIAAPPAGGAGLLEGAAAAELPGVTTPAGEPLPLPVTGAADERALGVLGLAAGAALLSLRATGAHLRANRRKEQR